MLVAHAVVQVLLDVSFSPNPSAIPGMGTLQDLANGIGGGVLIFLMLIGFIGIGLGVAAKLLGNSMVAVGAIVAFLITGGGAFMVMALPKIMNWLGGLGSAIH